MPARTRDFAWERTPLGPAERWPLGLKTAVALVLDCQLPMYLAWGPEFIQIYNDAYKPILGAKHPAALGQPAAETWNEIWPKIGPMWQDVLHGRAIGFDDFKLTIERYGYPEDCYFNFSYSAVHDDDGRPGGVLVTFAETTKRVLAERRYRFLDELSQATRALSEPAAAMKLTAEMLGRYLGVSRCAYAQVLDDQDTFDLIGDHNDGVDSIVGRYRFTNFGHEVRRLMQANEPYVNHDVDTDPVTAGTDLSAYRLTKIQAVICVPLHKRGRFVAAMAVHQSVPRHWTEDEIALVRTVVDRCWDTLERLRSDAALRDEARSLEILNRTGAALSAELDLPALVQRVTDAATELTGAKFGSFFYNGVDERGEALMLFALSGAPREAFEKLGHPRPTALFGPTFRGEAPIRIADVRQDARYGHFDPHRGMPAGHLPVRSYLAAPVIARSGEVIGGLFFGHPEPGVFTERSERLAVGIASQAAIAIDNARLYARAQQAAQERTMLLDSERNARLEAERASTIKDQFLATLSHELRTPLSAIRGWVHILRRKLAGADAELRKGLDVIERSTNTQVQLIDDLLDMSRISAGKLVLDLQAVEASAFVTAAVEAIAPSARSAGVELELQASAGTGQVRGDANRLQQVVWNLVANAIKFTPRGGRVRVTLYHDDSHAVIDVADTGVGIAPDALPHVFERFRQADGSITRRFGGLGLGLSIVRHLVEQHGGSVTAHSEGEGLGATFRVRLPLLDVQEALGSADTLGAADQDERLQGTRVLVVDDDADSRDLIRRLLEESGAQVDEADNADAALRAIEHGRYRLVVSDIGMPGTDGYQLLRQLRRLPPEKGGRVPAIALTAFAREEDRVRALAAGFDRHCAKPIDPPSLLATAAQLVERRGAPPG
ncbi:ATP-binding protein [Piscinibacter sp. HJYY11]|uniref:ATP-binding protein n=1 Tax=Piscinibacter sp. HJYY11 TaxID=2801333 RepID=UPI00191D8582|nr:ATP-binding protein [Piscinibacter sp. HJYY11]MBL0730063.1 GAF domain-containing protein [Piscinibacter sp. HJYY11]